jgi:hypothetical protein
MRRKPVLLALGIVLLLITCVGAALALLVSHQKSFYLRSAVPPGSARQRHSGAFVTACTELINNVHGRLPSWYATFTDVQINSYLEEDFIRSRTDKTFLPKGISAPRIAIERNKIRLGFRYGTPTWGTVVSIDLRLWLAKREANVVCLELKGLYAGAMPISSQYLLEHITEACQQKNIDIKWYRHNGNPVARLRFQNASQQPTVQLSKIELRPGMLVIGGWSLNPSAGARTLASAE